MENFRSKSCRDGRVRADENDPEPPRNMEGLRSYSVQRSYCYYGAGGQGNEVKAKKQGKQHVEVVEGSRNKAKGLKFDPELGKRKRVASYNAYGMEGKMKGSMRKGFRWVKDACNLVVHGWK